LNTGGNVLKREIDGINFKVAKLDVFKANELDRQIQELIPTILDGIEAMADGKDNFLDADLSAIAGVLRKIFEAMTPDIFETFCVEMLQCTKVVQGDNELPLSSRDVIANVGLKVTGLYKLLFAVMEENGFIPFDLLASGNQIEKILSSLGVSKITRNEKSGSEE
jgi:antitoxin component of RelBE/YafQ-DinJ toxin-antitoxin module